MFALEPGVLRARAPLAGAVAGSRAGSVVGSARVIAVRVARCSRGALVVLALLLLLLPGGPAAATSPDASPRAGDPGVIGTGDPRSEGEGPGLVGSPLLVALGVVALGLVTAAVTVVAVRLTRPD